MASPYLRLLKDRINLTQVPLSERLAPHALPTSGIRSTFRLAERWFKLDHQLSSYPPPPPNPE